MDPIRKRLEAEKEKFSIKNPIRTVQLLLLCELDVDVAQLDVLGSRQVHDLEMERDVELAAEAASPYRRPLDDTAFLQTAERS